MAKRDGQERTITACKKRGMTRGSNHRPPHHDQKAGSRIFVDSRPSSFGRMLRTFVAEGGNINPFLVEELTGVGHDVGGGEHLPFDTLTADGDAI